MSVPAKPDPLGDLPVLTEVVVPSPSGIKMPEGAQHPPSTTAPAVPVAPEEDVSGQKISETVGASQPFAKTSPFPALSPEYSGSVTSGTNGVTFDLDTAEGEDFPEPPPATHDEDVSAAFSEIREALVDALQKRFAIEIPTLVEAALQNALPMITHDIKEGLEENAKMALKDLIVSLRGKSSPLKKR